jgi:hypothetical protein
MKSKFLYEKKIILNYLAKKIKEEFNLKNYLYINYDKDFQLFDYIGKSASLQIKKQSEKKSKKIMIGDPFIELDKVTDNFDFIVADLPLGLKKEEWNDVTRKIHIKERKNWLILFKSLFLLSSKGMGLFIVESKFWGSFSGRRLYEQLNKYGFYVNAIFNTPDQILSTSHITQPILVLISKKKTEKLFISRLLDNSNVIEIINNYKLKNMNTKSIRQGIFQKYSEFKSFNRYEILKQLDKLKTQYHDFEKYTLGKISEEINRSKKLENKKNSIFIPSDNCDQIKIDFELVNGDHRDWIQVVLKKKVVTAEYLCIFFESEMGKLILKSLYHSGTFFITKEDIEECLVPIPPIKIQEKVIKTNCKFKKLNERLHEFEKEISLNPKNMDKIREHLDNLLDSLDLLNDEEKIFSSTREGESKTIEFKETLSKNIRTKQKDKNLEKAVLKTITAFINSDGGILLVGVNDEGNIKGIENDFFKSNDDYLNHLHNLIRDYIGEHFYPFIDYKIVNISDMKVLFIKCKQGNEPCYLGKDEEFFVRTNPATDKLTGRKLVEYIKSRFKK